MATPATALAELSRLRRDIARIEGRLAEEDRLAEPLPVRRPGSRAEGPAAFPASRGQSPATRLPFGIAPLDALLGGGLPLAALSEIRAGECRDGGVASGLALALAARLAALGRFSAIVWIGEAGLRRETGALYAPGLAALGLDPARIVEVTVRNGKEALWAFEAALSCRGVAVAVCELKQATLDLSATRRCALRARESGVTGLLLRLGNAWAEPSAAEIRFGVAPAPAGAIGGFDAGIGRMAWRLTLEKNRLGPTGAFMVEWDAHERSFLERRDGVRREGERREERRERTAVAYPEPLSAAASDRSPDPAAAEGNRLAQEGLEQAS